jgi:nucleoside-diphosphate kinase
VAQVERTLSIIKPDGVARDLVGEIVRRFERAGLKVAAIRRLQLTPEEAGAFYEVHRGRPFFADLVQYIASGPVVAMVLEGPDAIRKNREIMGATDPKKAAPGTIRADFSESIEANTVHGSDSAETARAEIAFFFTRREML